MSESRRLLTFDSRRKLKLVMQTELAECGLACLAMISGYYGRKIDLNTLRRNYPISLKGSSLRTIIEISDQLNLSSRAVRVNLEDISQLDLPCILHWDLNHFVVLKKTYKGRVVVMDPARGERDIPIDEAGKHFTGVALELIPAETFEPSNNEELTLRFSDLWARITGLKRNLVHILVFSLLLQFFVIVAPFYIRLVIDDVLVGANTKLLTLLAIGFGAVVVMQQITVALRSWVIVRLGSQFNIQVASNVFSHLIKLPLIWFEKRHIGDVVSRFSSLDEVKEMLTTGVIEAIVDGLMMIGTLYMLFIYNKSIAILVLSTILLYALIKLVIYRVLRQLNEESIIAQASEDTNFIETVRAMQTVKVFGKESQRQSAWLNIYASTINADIRLEKIEIQDKFIQGLLLGGLNIGVIYYAATAVLDQAMSVGMLFAFIFYMQQFVEKSISLIENGVQFGMLGLHLNRLGDIALNDIEQNLDSQSLVTTVKGKLEVRDIVFRYENDSNYLLDGVSMTIVEGESIALTGPSGCGKTTLLKIMLGLITPEEGEVLVDGVNIERLGHKQYRQHVAAVMQDDQLFSGSVADNISFFDPSADQEKVEKYARMASIHDDIKAFPMSYNTIIGDMGNTLSGGQRQRILLARALYKEPKILFLDEATSHLDTDREKIVSLNVKDSNMTRIIIAHRLESIKSADRIYELKDGKLLETKLD